jgi:hypothetical protein
MPISAGIEDNKLFLEHIEEEKGEFYDGERCTNMS